MVGRLPVCASQYSHVLLRRTCNWVGSLARSLTSRQSAPLWLPPPSCTREAPSPAPGLQTYNLVGCLAKYLSKVRDKEDVDLGRARVKAPAPLQLARLDISNASMPSKGRTLHREVCTAEHKILLRAYQVPPLLPFRHRRSVFQRFNVQTNSRASLLHDGRSRLDR